MIVEMSKVRLIAFKENKQNLLIALQRFGEFMIIESEHSESEYNDEGVAKKNDNVYSSSDSEAMIRFLSHYAKKKGILEANPEVTYDTFIQENEKGRALLKTSKACAETLNRLNQEINGLKAENELLAPWNDLDVPVEELKNTKYFVATLGYVPLDFKEVITEWIEEKDGSVNFYGTTKDGIAALVLSYADDHDETIAGIKTNGFVETMLSVKSGLVRERISKNTAEQQAKESEKEVCIEKIESIAKEMDCLELLDDQLKMREAREAVQYDQTEETNIFTGWVPADQVDTLRKAVEGVIDCYQLETIEKGEDELPPTKTKNKKIWKPFESITEMYAYPKPGTIDPTPVAAPWFWVIFGMMMGDVGYGALMAIVFGLYKKIKKPKGQMAQLLNLMIVSSITTIVFGVLFGSYFGVTISPVLFSPMDGTIPMLILSLVVGVLHIFCGMTIQIIESCRAGKLWDAVFDQISWMLIITGAGLLFLEVTRTIGIFVTVLGALIVLFTAGRDKPSLIGKLMGGISGLYGFSAYLSDILSYSRILALSLATAVIAYVMNMLAGMVQVNVIGFILSLAIYFVGHTFNFVMSLLSAYVHDSRLQYIEFFNKFYEGGGYGFNPLGMRPKRTNVVDGNKRY